MDGRRDEDDDDDDDDDESLKIVFAWILKEIMEDEIELLQKVYYYHGWPYG